MDFDEDLLRNIIGIVMVDHHFPHDAVPRVLILAHEQVEPITLGLRVLQLG